MQPLTQGGMDDYELLFENLPYGMAVYDEHEILMINRAGAGMLGYRPEEMLGRSVFDYIHPGSSDRARERIMGVITSASSMPLERLALQCRDGRALMIESTAIPYELDGRLIVQTVFKDITAELQAQREAARAREDLARSEERYRRLVEMADEGILTVDVNECISFINIRMAGALGFEPQELLGRCFLDFCEESAVARILEETARRRQGVSSSYELKLIDRQGRLLSFMLSATPLYNEQGEYEAALVVATDITMRVQEEEESRRLEASIFQARRMESLGVLAGGIAHDFNNLLMGILGNASLARMEEASEEKLASYLDRIERGALRASDLTQQMLTYSGRGSGRRETVELATIVREMVELLDSVISKRGSVQLELAQTLPPVHVDTTQLRQVVMNLVTNASQALPERDGVVRLCSRMADLSRAEISRMPIRDGVRPGRFICLEVSDNGCGMEPAELDRIFEPFYTTRSMGRGLGLATVFGIVRGHGGTLRVRSSPGKGTTFSIYLPQSGEALDAEPAELAVESGDQQYHGTVLVIEDEEMVREVTCDMLQRRGFRVFSAACGLEALDCFERCRFQVDAIVLDMSLPDMEADELFAELSMRRPGIPVIVASGSDEQVVDRVFKGLNLAGYMQKPFAPSELARKISEVMSAGD